MVISAYLRKPGGKTYQKMTQNLNFNLNTYVDIYFKFSTEINSLSKDIDKHSLVGLASKWLWP